MNPVEPLTDYELYVLEDMLTIRIWQTQATRDKCGISPDNMESEPNQRIQAMRSIAEKFNLTLSV